MDLESFVRDVPNFPKEGVVFKDVTPLLKDPLAFRECILRLSEKAMKVDFNIMVAPEARGFIFAAPLAFEIGKALVPVRKPGKLPYKTKEIEYELEYGRATLQMHVDAINRGDRVLIVDDILATGGTMQAIAEMIEESGGEVVEILCLAELGFLEPRKRLSRYSVETLITY
ncbi:adenine phosphoribosyltransferase [Mesotoga sp. HF07.pep.5.2.highcov]|jgi:adenine phosphoribosyltransferase|uniref:Adenine phosphoribosyltransferase n=1 Tax=Mesotoga prima MesG1.Ag.4.2 TaxID=660470 RepID=I2F2N9_9BACT|nr:MULTISPECIES: adenine phosphoribosyltransferase [Mesotoga]AFK06192.1 adenine phosphoribosyltransferase [Mesotoga prima MesG1.Ag.4.2]PIJ62001.1 adenine phosphoribosyltransferase [Mesotoga sp. H07.pep.5.3]RLL88343.1 adenine phosphoribosyltransferase [Mesotoga sp. H07pep.5.4]RLL92239.1 adenine phosphoribosyltransferase [Mesotoga sp. HF07.pep.5.2.highcov]